MSTNDSPIESSCRSRIAARDIVPAAHAAQPVGEEPRNFRPHPAHARIQHVGGTRRPGPSAIRQNARRPRLAADRPSRATRRPARRAPISRRSSSTALRRSRKHRFERIFPAGLDVEALPESMRRSRGPCPRAICVLSLPWPIFACSAASASARAAMSASTRARRAAPRRSPRAVAPAAPARRRAARSSRPRATRARRFPAGADPRLRRSCR